MNWPPPVNRIPLRFSTTGASFKLCQSEYGWHDVVIFPITDTRIEEITQASEQAADSLKEAEKRLAEMAVLIKNVSTYQKTKPLYEAYRKARNKERYRAAHERGLILHEAAAKALKAAQIGGRLPGVAARQAEYETLEAQKETLYADYGKLKKQVREYGVIRQNIDSILRVERQPEKERQTERG